MIVANLRKMESGEAADWLMERYPTTADQWGEAITIIPHLSWKRTDQVRLADYYLSRLPVASARAYQAFASFMKASLLIEVVSRYIPGENFIDLFEYYVVPVLTEAVKTPADREALQRLLAEIRTL